MMTVPETPWFVGDAVDLLERMRTLHIASVSERGVPLASVAPFVLDDGSLYVFLSALAGHTANLRAQGRASVLVARDEADSGDPFARARLSLQCAVSEEPRETPCWLRVLDRMVARLGETASTVRELPDFALFRLTPGEGQVVSGFARAKRLDGAILAAVLGAAAGRG